MELFSIQNTTKGPKPETLTQFMHNKTMKYGFILCFLEVGEHKYAAVQVIQTTEFKVNSTT